MIRKKIVDTIITDDVLNVLFFLNLDTEIFVNKAKISCDNILYKAKLHLEENNFPLLTFSVIINPHDVYVQILTF